MAVGLLAVLVACSGAPTTHGVVASFYPLAYAAQEVGGNAVSVTNLTGPGVEPHDLELTPRQVDRVQDAKAVFILGRSFQPAVERAAKHSRATIALIDRLGVRGRDPHVWLDPVLMTAIVDDVAQALAAAFPGHDAAFAARARALHDQVQSLDAEYRAGLADCARHEIVTSHEAFGRLAARYGLVQKPVTGLSPEAEPDPARLAQLTDLIKRDGVTTVFTEQLVSSRVADALARESGVRTEVLDPIEGLTKDEAKRGVTYLDLMRQNLVKLRAALGCR